MIRNLTNKRIGIELGTTYVKLVKVAYNKSKYRLLDYVIRPLPDCFNNGIIERQTVFSKLIRKYLEELSYNKSHIYITFDAIDIVSRHLNIPYMTHRELRSWIKYQISEYLPIDKDEYIVDYKVLSIQHEHVGRIMKILLGAIRYKVVDNLIRSLSLQEKIRIHGIDLYCNSIYKFFKSIIKDEIKTGIAVLDIGAKYTHITIFNEQFFKSHIIELGTELLIEALSENLNITKEQAEKNMISNLNLSVNSLVGSTHMIRIIEPLLQMLNQEILKQNEYYKSKNSGNGIKKIILLGGASNIDGINEYIQFNTGLNVFLFNDYIKDKNLHLFTECDQDINLICAAIGATLREVDIIERL